MEFIDISIPPTIYRTNNPEHYGKLAIDFMPETTPTVASFDNLQQVKEWLVNKFGEEQYQEWFPSGLAEKLPDGQVSYVN
ncbi:hypothetical protein [Nostoc sp. FACHB-190]|uniref:hypothetical protein n=1 Tax=Nostoc sp. FACHB-190 TaxID=2692838 RepID=UPI001682073A|nr:hypothetical protein [Nostoc sp. FACHB-190]MBD2303898.1 hypothetical protein [Nostoc sp. FACHB-190]